MIFARVQTKVRRLDVAVRDVRAQNRARVEVVQGVGELGHEPQALTTGPLPFDGSSHLGVVADLVQAQGSDDIYVGDLDPTVERGCRSFK